MSSNTKENNKNAANTTAGRTHKKRFMGGNIS